MRDVLFVGPAINRSIRGNHPTDHVPTIQKDLPTLNRQSAFANNKATELLVTRHLFGSRSPWVFKNSLDHQAILELSCTVWLSGRIITHLQFSLRASM